MARARFVVQVLPDDSPVSSVAVGGGVSAHASLPEQLTNQLREEENRVESTPSPQAVFVAPPTHHEPAREEKRAEEQAQFVPASPRVMPSWSALSQPVKVVEKPPVFQSKILQQREQLPTHAPDLFSQDADRIQQLFQEDRLAAAREEPQIQRPRTPKRLQEAHAPRESSFMQVLQKGEKAERIENFYKKTHQPESPKPVQRPKKSSRSLGLSRGVKRLALGLLVFALVAGSASFAGVSYVRAQVSLTNRDVQGLIQDLQTGQWQSAKERTASLQSRKNQAERLYTATRPLARVFLGKDKATNIDQLLEVSDAALGTLKTGFETQETMEKGFRQFVGKEDGKSLETFAHLTGQSEALYSELSSLQAKVDQLENPFELESITKLKSELSEEAPRLRKYFAAGQKIGAVLPELLGQEGKKQYLVLLQNNMELRPTGGFIGSFGILTVQNGRFLDFRVEDVYEADGQLNGFVTPPPEIVQYLGEAKWYMRDVNWNPDFPITSQQALWFLDKETGVKADGVIAINLHVAEKLIKALGPIELPDYNEVITQDNLYVRAQTHSEMNFFPGSTQKRDFLSALANQLFYKMMKEDAPKLALTKAFYESAEESQLMIALNETQSAQALAGLGWDGSVRTPQCPQPFASQTCFVDTVMQVEANVGVNKANQYIHRDIQHTVELKGGVAEHTRVMKINNAAKSNAWPEGVYRTFLRLYVPKEAQLRSVSINGQNIDPQSLKNTEEGQKRVIGVYTEVPIQTTSEITVSYEVPLPQSAPLAYSLFEQKQSGVGGDKLVHIVRTSDRPIITVAPQPKSAVGREVVFESDRSTHEFMAVEVQ